MPNEEPELSSRRRRSRLLLLQVVRDRGSITRSGLSAATGLSRSTIAEGVRDLLAEELISERRADIANGRGRPSALLTPSAPPGILAGIDMGHTHVAVALADADGKVLAESRQAVEVDHHPQVAMDTAAQLLRQCLAQSGRRDGDLIAAAAGIPGPLDATTGIVRSPAILSNWANVDTKRELKARFGLPVCVDNDANMGAQGEFVFGSARGSEHFIYVQASHGVGAGLILNGQSYRGTVGISGEIGHIQLPGATGLCRCGNHGCLETVVSVREVARQLAQIGLAVSADAQHPSLSAMADDPTGRRVLTAAGRTLGRVLADLCNALNPELLVIGGQLATGGAPVLQGVRESIDQYALPAISQATTVRSAQLGIRSEVMGAVARAIERAHTLV